MNCLSLILLFVLVGSSTYDLNKVEVFCFRQCGRSKRRGDAHEDQWHPHGNGFGNEIGDSFMMP